MVLARLPNLTELYLKGNPFLQKPAWQGQDGIGFYTTIREREKTDPARALAARNPGPRAFTREAFAEAWARDQDREPLFAALLAMADGWAFKPPIDDAKWAYLEEHVFPLAEVWAGGADGGGAGRFKQLQGIAKTRKGELERACRIIVAEVANDAAGDGAWICAELDDIKGDVAKGALKGAQGGACWLQGNALAPAEMFPKAAKNKFDRDALPPLVRCL